MNVEKLLKAKRIAIIGASDSVSFGGACVKNILNNDNIKNNVFLVNPKRDNINGVQCYKNIDDINDNIDMAVIATNKKTVIENLEKISKKGAAAAVLYASGFSETNKEEDILLEKEMIKKAEELDITIMGPNCAGFVNFIDDINCFAFLSEKRDRKGHIAFISQSGQIALSMMDNQNTHLSYVISMGNSAMLDLCDYMDFLIDDDDTKVISMYVENIKNVNRFENMLSKAKNKNKPVVILKMGKAQRTRDITNKHTGGKENFDNDDFNKLINNYNAIRVDDLEELIYLSMVLSKQDLYIKNNNIAAMTLSGGEAAIISEEASNYDYNFPCFNKETIDLLNESLPDYASINNPLDITVSISYDTERFARVLELLMKDENIGVILIGYTLLNSIDDPTPEYMLNAIKKVRENKDLPNKPVFIMSFMSNTRNQYYLDKLYEENILVLPSTKYGFSVLNKYFEYCKNNK